MYKTLKNATPTLKRRAKGLERLKQLFRFLLRSALVGSIIFAAIEILALYKQFSRLEEKTNDAYLESIKVSDFLERNSSFIKALNDNGITCTAAIDQVAAIEPIRHRKGRL